MFTLRKSILTACLVVLGASVSGCTAFTSFSEVDALNEAQPVGNPFTQALTSEYRQYSNTELKDMFDYPDALHFARKGLAAASGDMVLPEPVSDWNLSEAHAEELSAARGRLIVAYDMNAREVAPELAARAQSRFDCWIEQQEENWSDGQIACRDEFYQALQELEGMLQPPPVEPVMEPVSPFDVDESQPMQAENAMYLVFFDWDSTVLSSGALNVLDAVAEEVANNPPNTINVVGHTDTSGPQSYNDRLAVRRANVVKDALIERGIAADKIVTDAKGENELLVPTPDGVREPANRRTNISFD